MIAHYQKETRPVSVWALGLLALFGAVVLTDAAPRSSGRSGQPLARLSRLDRKTELFKKSFGGIEQ